MEQTKHEHDYRLGTVTGLFFRSYYVVCQGCDYYRHLGKVWRWKRGPRSRFRIRE